MNPNQYAEPIGPEPEGIVYRRTNPETGETYVGQAKSPDRFDARQGEHDNALGVKHDYEILGRAQPGKPLDVLEETKIRENGGIQREGGTLTNARHQMSEGNYQKYGGTTPNNPQPPPPPPQPSTPQPTDDGD